MWAGSCHRARPSAHCGRSRRLNDSQCRHGTWSRSGCHEHTGPNWIERTGRRQHGGKSAQSPDVLDPRHQARRLPVPHRIPGENTRSGSRGHVRSAMKDVEAADDRRQFFCHRSPNGLNRYPPVPLNSCLQSGSGPPGKVVDRMRSHGTEGSLCRTADWTIISVAVVTSIETKSKRLILARQ